MFRTDRNPILWLVLAGVFATSAVQPIPLKADDSGRKLKSEVRPAYPPLAKQMNISGVVKVEVTIAPNGTVKNTKVLGGHPLLASAAEEAAKKRRYEPGPNEDKEIVVYNFSPNQ